MDGVIPIHVRVPVETWMPLALKARDAGFDSPTAYVQHMVVGLVAVATETDDVLFRHSLGMTNKQIAVTTGLTIHSIQGRLARAGLRSNTGRN